MSLDSAILIATKAHRGQVDKGGNPYILHPLRVMIAFTFVSFNPRPYRQMDYMLAAVLHDVVEDSEWTLEQLHEAKCPPVVLEALDHLSRRKEQNESYSNYIARVRENAIAHTVKMQDLADNLLVTRLRPSQITREAGLLERELKTLIGLLDIVTPEQAAARKAEAMAALRRARGVSP
jgi:(p)ppGpp synthase/HD superfamily hydrolase